jgi:transposase
MEAELQILEEFIKTNPDSLELKRALGVKLALSGYAYRAIQEIIGVTPGFIAKWKKEFISAGIEGIILKYKGSRPYLNAEEKQELIQWIINQSHWDIWELETYVLETYEVVFKSRQSYYQLLKEARISWPKAEQVNPKKDAEEVKKKNEEISQLLESKKEEIQSGKLAVYLLDECHLVWKDVLGHLWNFIKERLKEGQNPSELPERTLVKIKNEKERQTYYGALNLVEKEFILAPYKAGKVENTVDFLKKLIQSNPGRKILIIWDGASYHSGEEMSKFLTEQNQGLSPEDWQITCHKFARYAPEENPVEAIWLQLKNLLRRFYWLAKNFRVVKRLFEFFAKFQLFNFPNLKKYDAFSQFI